MKIRSLLLAAGSLSIVLLSFFATLFVLNWVVTEPDLSNPDGRDSVRADNAKSVLRALAEYRSEHGSYPVLPSSDVTVAEVSTRLVSGGYLRKVPGDPPGTVPDRYVSFDGNAFGLWLHFEKSPACLVEIGATKTGWWGQPPPCKL